MPATNTQILPWLFMLTFLCLLLAIQHRFGSGQKVKSRFEKLSTKNFIEKSHENIPENHLEQAIIPESPKSTHSSERSIAILSEDVPDEKSIFYSPPPRGQLNLVMLPKRSPIPHKSYPNLTTSTFGFLPKPESPVSNYPNNKPSKNCDEKQFSDNFPVTAIHAFRGAGNAWIRSLIEEATGFHTGSTYNDDELYQGGLRGEVVDQDKFETVVGISSHTTVEAVREQRLFQKVRENDKSKCVIVIRNPFDTFVAQFVHLTTGGRHVGGKPDSWDKNQVSRNFRQLGEVKLWYWGGLGYWNFTDEKNFKPRGGFAGTWFRSYYAAYNQCRTKLRDEQEKSVLVVTFESLIYDRVFQAKRIAKFLGQYDQERFENCIENPMKNTVLKKGETTPLDGKFKRSQRLQLNVFNSTTTRWIQDMVLKLNETMKVLPESYLHNPFQKYEFVSDEQIWKSGNCRIGDLCFGRPNGSDENHWFKNGNKREICAEWFDLKEKNELRDDSLIKSYGIVMNGTEAGVLCTTRVGR